MIIDYTYLALAMDKYKKLGYEFVEVPWIVSYESHSSTASPPDGAFVVEDRGCLVGSAEQGFIEIIDSLLPNKKYASISPCFRKNDNRDEYHQETFMKLELFSYDTIELHGFNTMISDAIKVFDKLGIDKTKIQKIRSMFDESIDLCYNGTLELGSYGQRSLIRNGTITHVINYGTGLALPRFSQALEQYNQYLKHRFED